MALISVRVNPRSSQNKVQVQDGVVKVWTTAPPVDGEANAAVCELLAKALKVPKTSVQVVSGAGSREKRIQIDGMDIQRVMQVLE